LKFAEIIFTHRKADSKHTHSFNSYLLRIPHTLNSKCIRKGTDAEVKIIQKFDALYTTYRQRFVASLEAKLVGAQIGPKAVVKYLKKMNYSFTLVGLQDYIAYFPKNSLAYYWHWF
jgi:hypothetical protein